MPKNHMKRVAAPKTWPIQRKTTAFVMRSDAGKRMDLSMPLGLILREILGITENSRQTKAVLNAGSVIVDGKVRKELRFPVGLYEVVEITSDKKQFRVGFSPIGSLSLIPISAAEKSTRLQKVVSKLIVPGNKLQLGLLSGVVVRMDANPKNISSYTVGDSVQLDSKNGVEKHLPLQVGSVVQFIGGKHIGGVGVVESIVGEKITASVDGQSIETRLDCAVVVGEGKSPSITVLAKVE